MEFVPYTEDLKKAGCNISREDVIAMLSAKIGGTSILEKPLDAAFHVRGAPDLKWFPHGKPHAKWTAAEWTDAINQWAIVRSCYEMAQEGTAGCTRQKEAEPKVAHTKLADVKYDHRVNYILFGTSTQIEKAHGLSRHLYAENVKHMDEFGCDCEDPLTDKQKVMLKDALQWAGDSITQCCCNGGKNRSAFMRGLLEITYHGGLSKQSQPINALYKAILEKYEKDNDLDEALAVVPKRPNRKRSKE